MSFQIRACIESLANEFTHAFPEHLQGPRTLGREAEYPVVLPNGEAADVRLLLAELAKHESYQAKYENDLIVEVVGSRYSYSLEVGWGTIEIVGGVCQDLHMLKILHEQAFQDLKAAADELGFLVLGYGTQPLTPSSVDLMSPKSRYQILHQVIGDPWLWFCNTASEQVHVNITRDEIIPMLNLANVLSPAIIALCGNSPIIEQSNSGFCSSREGRMQTIFPSPSRHGMTSKPMKDLSDWIEYICNHRFLTRKIDGQYQPEDGLFTAYLEKHGPIFSDFLMHEHYLWNSARPRTAHGTIEIRPACQQPWSEHMAAATLGVGIVIAAESIQQWWSTWMNPWALFGSHLHSGGTLSLHTVARHFAVSHKSV